MKALVREQYQALADKAHMLAPEMPRPREGWIRSVRKALGMSGPQLARRLDLSRSQVTQMERMEADDRITLKQLRRVAEALDCELVYALAPRHPVQQTLQKRAEQLARTLLGRAHTHMVLEAQQLTPAQQEKEVAREATRLLNNLPRDFWEDT